MPSVPRPATRALNRCVPPELKDLEYTVDVLDSSGTGGQQRRAGSQEIRRDRGGRLPARLLLPDLEGVDTVDHQIDICRQKAASIRMNR